MPLLFGAASVRGEGGSAARTTPRCWSAPTASIRDAYDKNLLVPFAEYAAVRAAVPSLAGAFPHAQHFAAAHDDAARSRSARWRIATPICYEAVRPAFVRRMVREAHPHLLVTLANDAWFGDSQEPWIHLAMARLRAIEHRRYLVRATNSGVSAHRRPAGRVRRAQRPAHPREPARRRCACSRATTLYARLGDWPGWLARASLLALLVVPSRRVGRAPDSAVRGQPAQ